MNTTAPHKIENLRIKLFLDGGRREDILAFVNNSIVKGFTTNPSLLREAGVTDYGAYAHELLALVGDKPISFEVFADDFTEMERQAHVIHSWGANVYVKIPITNTEGSSSAPLMRTLSAEGIRINATAILTLEQVEAVCTAIAPGIPTIISVFAGRIADTGVDPLPIMRECADVVHAHPGQELLWASCRETFNIYEAESVGADIITVPPAILHKLREVGTDLTAHSLAGVQRFYEDGKASGFSL